MKNKTIIFSIFLCSLAGFYLLNHLTTIAIDDYSYKFIVTDNPDNDGQRVETLYELVKSQYKHYFIINGRILANGLAQLFLMTDNKIWFNIANTIMFALLQVLIFFLLSIKIKDISVPLYIQLLVFLWFLIPGPNHTLLWLTGSLNYLWSSVLVLGFLYIHKILSNSSSSLSLAWYPLLFITGFISGATHEVISIGISGALCLYYVFHLKNIKYPVIPLITGFFLGTIFMLLSPGNMIRFSSGGVGEVTFILTIAQKIWAMTNSISSLIAMSIMVIVLFCLYFRDRHKVFEIIKNNHLILLLLLSIPFSLVFIMFAGAYQPRVFFGVSLFSIIILISVIWQYRKLKVIKMVFFATYLLAAAMVVEFFYVTQDLKANKQVFVQDEILWMESEDNVFEFRRKKFNRFVSGGLGGYDRYFWSNIRMSGYYDKEYLVFLPPDLYKGLYASDHLINNKNKITEMISIQDSIIKDIYDVGDFIILPVPKDVSSQIERGAFVNYLSKEPILVNKLDMRQKIAKILYGRSPSPIINEKKTCFVLETYHGHYIYFKAPVNIPRQKIKNISIYKNVKQEKVFF